MSNSAWVKIDIRAMIEAIEGEIIPSIYSTSSYSGDVYIRPSNQSIAKLSIVQPTVYTKRIYPIKDVYIDKNNNILNFGNNKSLVTDNDNRFRTFISFSLNEIPEYAVIESAKFNLYKQNFTNHNSINVYNTSNNYDEIGVTYLNAPVRGDLLYTQEISNNTGYITKDLLEYTNDWYSDSKSTNRAFDISSDKSEIIIFDSDEGINRPYIEVQYYVQNQNIGFNEVYGEIEPVCIRDYEFSGEIFVESDSRMDPILSGSVNILNNSRSIEAYGEISSVYSGHNEYYGETNILAYNRRVESEINDISPIIINTIYYTSEINIIQIKDRYSYDGEILVEYDDSLEYNGEIVVEYNASLECNGEIVVEYNASLECNGEIAIAYNNSLEYNGDVNILAYNRRVESEINDISPIIINTIYHTNEINIIQIKDRYSYDGEILVEHNISLEYNGEILVEYDDSLECDGEIVISHNDSLEYNGEIVIAHSNSLEYYGDVNIIAQNNKYSYNGEIAVEYDDSLEYNGEINILPTLRELEYNGEINILPTLRELEYNGEISPTILRFETIEGIIDINNKSYGIMTFDCEIVIKRSDSGYVFIL